MKTTKMKSRSVVNVAGAGALALLMATSAFAAPQRGNDERRDDSYRGQTQSRRSDDRSGYRENQRVNATGKITSLTRENGGYRVQLDRGRESYRIPASSIRNRGNDLRVGVSIVLGGIFRGGRIDVDAVSWPGNGGYRNNGGYRDDYVSGVVERVDRRSGVLVLRDAGRTIEVDMRDTVRSSRVDFSDLRRGDVVTLSGQWTRGGLFAADRIDSVRSGRR